MPQAALEHAREPRARHGIVESIAGRIEVLGQLAFLAHEMPRVLVRRRDPDLVDVLAGGHALEELFRLDRRDAVVLVLDRDQRAVGPERPPSRRQYHENDQRGSGSPGYHLPWP